MRTETTVDAQNVTNVFTFIIFIKNILQRINSINFIYKKTNYLHIKHLKGGKDMKWLFTQKLFSTVLLSLISAYSMADNKIITEDINNDGKVDIVYRIKTEYDDTLKRQGYKVSDNVVIADIKSDCPSSVEIPSKVKDKDGKTYSVIDIGKNSSKGNIENLILPETMHYIYQYKFTDYKSLQSIAGSGITEIGDKAFNLNKSVLRSVNFVNCKTVRGDAFKSCSNLVTVNLPNVETIIGGKLFQENNNRKEINLPKLKTWDCNNDRYAKLFSSCKSLTIVRLPKLENIIFNIQSATSTYLFEKTAYIENLDISSLKTLKKVYLKNTLNLCKTLTYQVLRQ